MSESQIIARAEPDIIIIGAGGHARVMIEILRRRGLKPVAAVDRNPALHGTVLDGVPVIGGDDAVLARAPADVRLVSGYGNAPGKGASGLARRREGYERLLRRGYVFMSVISPDAYVSTNAVLEDGCQVITGAIIHPGSVIGTNVIINTGARIDHDCIVGPHSHIAPGAVVCGGVEIGPETHVGAGAVIIPQIKIGTGAVIGAGAVVVADVAAGATVIGVPAR